MVRALPAKKNDRSQFPKNGLTQAYPYCRGDPSGPIWCAGAPRWPDRPPATAHSVGTQLANDGAWQVSHESVGTMKKSRLVMVGNGMAGVRTL